MTTSRDNLIAEAAMLIWNGEPCRQVYKRFKLTKAEIKRLRAVMNGDIFVKR